VPPLFSKAAPPAERKGEDAGAHGQEQRHAPATAHTGRAQAGGGGQDGVASLSQELEAALPMALAAYVVRDLAKTYPAMTSAELGKILRGESPEGVVEAMMRAAKAPNLRFLLAAAAAPLHRLAVRASSPP
jgi:hypothetical protein